MKLRFTCLLALLAMQVVSYAKDFAPLGAQWIYEFDSQRAPMAYSTGTVTYTVTKDTLIGDINARKIEGVRITPHGYHEIERDTTVESPMYVYNEGPKAYLSLDGKTFHLYFDYGLSEGDEVEIGPFSSDCPEGTRLKVQSISLDEKGFKKYRFELAGEEQYILELGGSKYGFWPVIGMATGGGQLLKSYTENATRVELVPKEAGFAIYPNQTKDELIIRSNQKISEVRIYSGAGALVHKGRTEKVSMVGISAGVYTISIEFEDGNRVVETFLK
ncbi:MAG: T9SS type A sorting domain-containing protein [Paludibacteraceae bacterium]|nr:T9SS type A sorting domain-containing protein [Paludibacteraceae bacterium]